MTAGPLILVVDDNAANAKLAGFVLRAHGFEVHTVASAEAAERALAARLPAAVLMDLQLPGTDGLTLTRRLKADPRTAALPVFALTAYAMRGDEARARAAGCDAWFTKPIDTRTFARRVAQLLEERPFR